MNRRNGAARIFLYNWPIFVGTWIAGGLLIAAGLRWPLLAPLGAIAIAWSLAALIVSFYIYDRSPLVAAEWMRALLRAPVRTWATVHAGLDAEVDSDRVMAGRCVGRLDIFDAAVMTSSSIIRARTRTALARPAVPCSPTALALDDASCDAVVVAFTAHEIRDLRARERFFDELHRVLAPGGTLLLVEHLRDFMNLFAFGPGFLHFLPRGEWLRLAARANLSVTRELRVTPFVMALALRKGLP